MEIIINMNLVNHTNRNHKSKAQGGESQILPDSPESFFYPPKWEGRLFRLSNSWNIKIEGLLGRPLSILLILLLLLSIVPTIGLSQDVRLSEIQVSSSENQPFTLLPNWKGIVIHHTASKNLTLDDCHKAHRARGWDSCGYNFIISPDGKVVESRGFYEQGAHAKGYNSTHLGIAVVANGTANTKQLITLQETIHLIQMLIGDVPITGHNEHRPTACPGNILKQMRQMEASA